MSGEPPARPSNNSRALVASDLTHVGQNSPYMISSDNIHMGGLNSHIAESPVYHSKRLQDDMQELGQKIKHHEDNVKYLKHHKNKLEESIMDMQLALGKNHISSSTREEDPSQLMNEKKIIQNILKCEGSAAAWWYRMKNQPETQASYLSLTKDVIGIVATLGMVDDDNLSRLLAEYLGLDTMLAIVCKTYESVKALEIYNRQGLIDKSLRLRALGASTARPLDGQFRIICLEQLRPYIGNFIDDDPQQRLDLLKPKLVSGELPPGFLGFAVNMITIKSANLNGISDDGRNLRESLFYNLFSGLQVYRSREDMLNALPLLSNGAISLDGGVIKSPGVFDKGQQRGDMDVIFPNGPDRFNLPANYFEIEHRLKETGWKKTRTMDDLQVEQSLLDQAQINYEKKKQEFVKFLAQSSSFVPQAVAGYMTPSSDELVSTMYTSDIFVDSAPAAATTRILELWRQGQTVVCSHQPLHSSAQSPPLRLSPPVVHIPSPPPSKSATYRPPSPGPPPAQPYLEGSSVHVSHPRGSTQMPHLSPPRASTAQPQSMSLELRAFMTQMRDELRDDFREQMNAVRSELAVTRGLIFEIRAVMDEIRAGMDEIRAWMNEIRAWMNEIRAWMTEIMRRLGDTGAVSGITPNDGSVPLQSALYKRGLKWNASAIEGTSTVLADDLVTEVPLGVVDPVAQGPGDDVDPMTEGHVGVTEGSSGDDSATDGLVGVR